MNDDPIIIRPYRSADLPELRRITIESFGSVALEQMLEHKFGIWNGRDWKARKSDHIDDDVNACPEGCLVAERGGEILGYITMRMDRLNSKGRIPNLAVVESARGLGLGRRMIQHALDVMRSEGMKIAQIETMTSNAIGQHLYPSCGFEEVARQVHYAMHL